MLQAQHMAKLVQHYRRQINVSLLQHIRPPNLREFMTERPDAGHFPKLRLRDGVQAIHLGIARLVVLQHQIGNPMADWPRQHGILVLQVEMQIVVGSVGDTVLHKSVVLVAEIAAMPHWPKTENNNRLDLCRAKLPRLERHLVERDCPISVHRPFLQSVSERRPQELNLLRFSHVAGYVCKREPRILLDHRVPLERVVHVDNGVVGGVCWQPRRVEAPKNCQGGPYGHVGRPPGGPGGTVQCVWLKIGPVAMQHAVDIRVIHQQIVAYKSIGDVPLRPTRNPMLRVCRD